MEVYLESSNWLVLFENQIRDMEYVSKSSLYWIKPRSSDELLNAVLKTLRNLPALIQLSGQEITSDKGKLLID